MSSASPRRTSPAGRWTSTVRPSVTHTWAYARRSESTSSSRPWRPWREPSTWPRRPVRSTGSPVSSETGSSSRVWSTLMPMPTTATGPSGVSTLSTRIPQTLRPGPEPASTRTSLGHFSAMSGSRSARAAWTAYPVRSGSHGHDAAGTSGRSSTENVSDERGGVSQARSRRPRPAVWCSVTSTSPGSSPARARSATAALVDGADSTTSTRQPAGVASRSRSRGGRGAGLGVMGLDCPRDRARGTTPRQTGPRDQPTGGHGVSAQPGEGTDVPSESEIDVHTTAGKLADLERRLDEAVHAGSEKAIEKQHAKGRRTARERIEMLFDEGTFVELDELARHRSTAFGLEKNRPYGDGVVTGYGTVDIRQVCVFSQDFTVFGGSLGEVYGEKITKVMDLAIKTGCPIIGINEGVGARIQEGVVSLGLYGEIFRRNVHASGVIPQISLIMGNCAGGHVYSPAVTDFTIMVDQTSAMFITGPDVIKTVTGEDVTMEDLGGARAHNTKSGNAHYMGADEEDAIEYVKALLSYLPQNNLDESPTYDDAADTDFSDLDRALDTIIPDSPNQPYDMHDVITTVLDDQEFLEVQE